MDSISMTDKLLLADWRAAQERRCHVLCKGAKGLLPLSELLMRLLLLMREGGELLLQTIDLPLQVLAIAQRRTLDLHAAQLFCRCLGTQADKGGRELGAYVTRDTDTCER